MFLGAFGYQRISGEPRFWLDFDYLLDGMRLVPMILGLFALPEVIGYGLDGAQKPRKPATLAALREGGLAVFRNFGLSLRSSIVGVLVAGNIGQRGQQVARIRVPRRLEQGVGRGILDDGPRIHYGDAATDRGDGPERSEERGVGKGCVGKG